MTVRWGRLLGLLVAVAASASSCRCQEPPSSVEDPEGARRVPSALPAEASAPRRVQAPVGSPKQPTRVVELAVYTPAPISKEQLERARGDARAKLPDVPVVSKEKDPPGVIVEAPELSTYEPPDEASLVYSSKGMSPAEMKAAAASKGALVLAFAFDDDPKLTRLRATQALMADLATAMGGFVWDGATREMFTVAAWREARVQSWQGDVPDAQRHFTIHYYETDGGRHRAVTLGLQKLGLPDLVIQDVPTHASDSASSLINVVVQQLVEGATIGPEGRMLANIESIEHVAVRGRFRASVIGNPDLRTAVDLVVAEREQGDAENRLFELRFATQPGATEVERLYAATDALFGGKEDATLRPGHDPELAAITRRVQARLPAIAAAYQKGLPFGERISVKAPFDTDEQGVEWMWISVTGWKDELIEGNLANEPFHIAALKAGAKVEVKQASVADYLWAKKDGPPEGGESIQVLQAREKTPP